MPKIKCKYCELTVNAENNTSDIVYSWNVMLDHELIHEKEKRIEEEHKKHEEFCKNKCPYRNTTHYECAIYGDNK